MLRGRYRWFAYLIAFSATGFVVALRYGANSVLGNGAPLMPFLLAVLVSSYFGGVGPGLVATTLGGTLGVWLFLGPQDGANFGSADVVRLAIYSTVGASISIAFERISHSRRNERRTVEIMQALQDGFFSLDNAGRLTFQNRVAAQHLGTKDDARGKPLWSVARAAGLNELKAACDRAARERVPVDLAWSPPSSPETVLDARVRPVSGGLAVYLSDVTGRRRADADAARLSALVDSASDAIFSLNLNGAILTWNAAAERLFKLPAGEIIGQSVRRLVPDEHLSRQAAVYADVRAGKSVQGFETMLRRGDGRLLDVSLSLAPVNDAAGQLTAVSIVAHDLSDLRRSEAMMKLTTDALPVLIAFVDAERRYQFVNPSYGRWFGKSSADYVGRAVKDVVGAGAYDRVKTYMDRALAGESVTFEQPAMPYQSGRARDIEVTYVPKFDVDGKVEGFVSLVSDVTQRRLIDAAVRESEARFRAMADGAPVLIWTADADGRVTWVNRTRLDFTGLSLDDEIAEACQSPVHADDRAAFAGACRSAASEAGEWRCEYRLRHRDGTYRNVLEQGKPIHGLTGEIIGLIGTGVDISELRRVAEERQRLLESEQAARLDAERAGRMKDEFLATLSHELRTPLNSILGWSQLLSGGILGPEETAGALETIDRNARAQAQLIEDLLDMSRIVSGKVRLETRPLDIAVVVNAALESVRPAATAKEITLGSGADAGAVVLGDSTRLQQVVWNLLSNAVKFTPRGGRVTVLTRVDHDAVRLTVTDTGQGIEPEFLPHVFERFRQADASVTRRFGGLGLGLSIVKHLVELHGGTASVDSEGAGRGATFTIRLPLHATIGVGDAGHTDKPNPIDAARDRLRGRTVLVIDDEADALALVTRTLQACDAHVSAVASAEAALAVLENFTPDLIISDIAMPDVDGHELIRRARLLIPRDRHVPAVALTAFARPEDKARALMAGFTAHLAKPVEPATLVTAAAAALDENI